MSILKKYFMGGATICMFMCSLVCMKTYSQCNGGNISNWTNLGPTSLPPCAGTGCLGNGSTGVGRTTGIWRDPNSTNILFLNSWHGGLYKTTNQGASWVRSYVGLDRLDVSALAFDPDNSNIIYCSTGDNEDHQKGLFNEWSGVNPYETATTGLFKSTDAGATWAKLPNFPLNNNPNDYMNKTRITTIKIKKVGTIKAILVGYSQNTVWPSDANGNNLCCELADNKSKGGILRSTNDGTTWTDVITNATSNASKIDDIEFDPNTSSHIAYAGGHRLWRSTDLGATWTNISNRLTGLDMSTFVHGGKIKLAVSAAREYNVYVTAFAFADWASENTRLWVSTDKLASNLPTAKINSSSFADVVFEVGQTVPSGFTEPIVYCTSNLFAQRPAILNRSIDGGNTFTQSNGYWDGNYHVDIRGLVIMPDNAVFMATDGGPYYSPANQMANATITNNFTWTYRGNGLSLASVMGMSLSKTNDNVFIGCFDNSWMYYDATDPTDKWKMINIGGDGGLALINGANASLIHMGTYAFNWGFRYSTNKGINIMDVNQDSLPQGSLFALERHPSDASTMYIGWCNIPGGSPVKYGLYKSLNQGNSWILEKDFASEVNNNAWETIRDIKVAESNNSVMYVLMSGALFRSGDNGTSWLNRSPVGFNPNQGMYKLAVSPTNPDKIWISYLRQSDMNNGAGYTGLIYSANGGVTWQSYNQGLPAEAPVYSLCTDSELNDDALYAGTAHGIYYRDSKTNGWVCFGNNLPPIRPNALAINTSNDMLYVGFFGGGVWRSPRACNQAQYYYNTAPKLGTRKHIGDIVAGWSAPNSPFSLDINNGETAEYVSARSVSLKPGFRASAGANFRARIYNNTLDCGWIGTGNMRMSDNWEQQDSGTDVANALQENTLVIVPNPNKGYFEAIWKGDYPAEWELKDLYGKTIQAGLDMSKASIHTEHIAKGIYLFSVLNSGKVLIKKVIVE